jgi:cytoskeletal protein CcmA (bactofilin family)
MAYIRLDGCAKALQPHLEEQMKTKKIFLSRIFPALMLALILALPFASPASAGEVIPGNPNALVGPDEVIEDDLFISGQRITIDGLVRGNVFAGGQDVIVNGTIEGNLFATGQVLVVNGHVTGSLFAAGYSLEIGSEASIDGSTFFGGFAINAANGSQIDQTLYMGGYQAELAGNIGRDVIAGLGAIKLDGTVNRNVMVELGQSNNPGGANPEEFTFYIPGNVEVLEEGFEQTDNAVIGGEVDYRINEYQVDIPEINPNVDIGEEIASAFIANAVRTRIGEFVALLIVGALFFYMLPKQSADTMAVYEESPFTNIGWGMLVALLFPAFLVLLMLIIVFLAILFGIITLGELVGTIVSLGVLTFSSVWIVAGLVFWMLSKTLFGFLVGQKLLERIRPESLDGRWAVLIALAIGLLLYEILRAIPALGLILALLVVLAGVGAFFQHVRGAWQARRAS